MNEIPWFPRYGLIGEGGLSRGSHRARGGKAGWAFPTVPRRMDLRKGLALAIADFNVAWVKAGRLILLDWSLHLKVKEIATWLITRGCRYY